MLRIAESYCKMTGHCRWSRKKTRKTIIDGDMMDMASKLFSRETLKFPFNKHEQYKSMHLDAKFLTHGPMDTLEFSVSSRRCCA